MVRMAENTCRICNTSDSIMIPIFKENAKNESIYYKVLRLFDIQLYADDSAPLYFCSQCVHQVEQALILKKKLEVFQKPLEEWCVQCCFCDIEMLTCNELKTHMMTAHSTKDSFFCSQCNIQFPLLSLYFAHCLRAHRGRNYKCKKCKLNFELHDNWASHLKSHEIEIFQCKFCKKQFQDISSWRKHISNHSERIKRLNNKGDCSDRMQEHLKIHFCLICKEGFSEAKTMMEHVVAFHEEPNDCDKAISPRNEFIDGKCVKCNCPSGISARKSVGHHSSVQHLHPKQPKFRQCSYCPKKFRGKSSWDTHMRTHTGEMPYECSECKRSFRQVANLKMHVFRKHKINLTSHQGHLSAPSPYTMDTSTYLMNHAPYSGTIDPSQVFYNLDMDYAAAAQGAGPSYQ